MANSTSLAPLWAVGSSIYILIWFEIITACITYGFGFIGNLLSVFIFLHKEFRNNSTGTTFLFLNLSNTIHLWTLTTEFLDIFDVYIYDNEFLRCRLNYFVQNVSRTVSTYLAVTIALDRLIRSEFLMRARTICTCRNAIKLALSYVLVSCVLHSFWFCPSNAINPVTGTCYNGLSSAYAFFFNQIFVPLRMVFVCLVPVIIMGLANFRMLFNIRQSRRRVQPENEANERTTSLDRSLFCMMVNNVGTFVITQIPFHVYTLRQVLYGTFDEYTYLVIRAMLLIWSSIYFGVGFYLYCLASPLFRDKFFLIVRTVIRVVARPCSR